MRNGVKLTRFLKTSYLGRLTPRTWSNALLLLILVIAAFVLLVNLIQHGEVLFFLRASAAEPLTAATIARHQCFEYYFSLEIEAQSEFEVVCAEYGYGINNAPVRVLQEAVIRTQVLALEEVPVSEGSGSWSTVSESEILRDAVSTYMDPQADQALVDEAAKNMVNIIFGPTPTPSPSGSGSDSEIELVSSKSYPAHPRTELTSLTSRPSQGHSAALDLRISEPTRPASPTESQVSLTESQVGRDQLDELVQETWTKVMGGGLESSSSSGRSSPLDFALDRYSDPEFRRGGAFHELDDQFLRTASGDTLEEALREMDEAYIQQVQDINARRIAASDTPPPSSSVSVITGRTPNPDALEFALDIAYLQSILPGQGLEDLLGPPIIFELGPAEPTLSSLDLVRLRHFYVDCFHFKTMTGAWSDYQTALAQSIMKYQDPHPHYTVLRDIIGYVDGQTKHPGPSYSVAAVHRLAERYVSDQIIKEDFEPLFTSMFYEEKEMEFYSTPLVHDAVDGIFRLDRPGFDPDLDSSFSSPYLADFCDLPPLPGQRVIVPIPEVVEEKTSEPLTKVIRSFIVNHWQGILLATATVSFTGYLVYLGWQTYQRSQREEIFLEECRRQEEETGLDELDQAFLDD